MPALLLGLQRDTTGVSNPELESSAYRAGEIVGAYDENTRFGLIQMPVNPRGSFTVEQANNLQVTTLTP